MLIKCINNELNINITEQNRGEKIINIISKKKREEKKILKKKNVISS